MRSSASVCVGQRSSATGETMPPNALATGTFREACILSQTRVDYFLREGTNVSHTPRAPVDDASDSLLDHISYGASGPMRPAKVSVPSKTLTVCVVACVWASPQAGHDRWMLSSALFWRLECLLPRFDVVVCFLVPGKDIVMRWYDCRMMDFLISQGIVSWFILLL